MARTEWYRRTTWTPADQEDFAAHLKRSRSPVQKAQYLRIQAHHLQEVGGSEMVRASLSLLDDLIENYPDNFSLGTAYMQKGQCLEELGRADDALEAYRVAIQRANPHVRDSAYIAFGELVLKMDRKDLYPEALAFLEEFGGHEYFPAESYRYNGARALMFEEMGRESEARLAARVALGASQKTESPFRYHRKLGLVREIDEAVHRRLVAIAQSQNSDRA